MVVCGGPDQLIMRSRDVDISLVHRSFRHAQIYLPTALKRLLTVFWVSGAVRSLQKEIGNCGVVYRLFCCMPTRKETKPCRISASSVADPGFAPGRVQRLSL